MKRIILIVILFSTMQIWSAQEAPKNQNTEELRIQLDRLKELESSLKQIKVVQRRTGKLSSKGGLLLFRTIIESIMKFESHNTSLKGLPNFLTINQLEFWRQEFYKSTRDEIDLIVSPPFVRKEYHDFDECNKIIDVLCFKNIISSALTEIGFKIFLAIYQDVARIAYYTYKTSKRFVSDSRKRENVFIDYQMYKNFPEIADIFEFTTGKFDYWGRSFIGHTLDLLISSYEAYIELLEAGFNKA